MLQLLIGKAGFVVAKTPNTAPMLLVKANWNKPSLRHPAAVTLTATGTGTLTFSTLPVLGIPFTKAVASAQPGGKPNTGAEVNEFVVHVVPGQASRMWFARFPYCAIVRADNQPASPENCRWSLLRFRETASR